MNVTSRFERHSTHKDTSSQPDGLLPLGLANFGRQLPPGYVHLGFASEIVPVLAELGVDSEPILREARLDPCLFDFGINAIPQAALGRLLSLGVARSRCPHLGLLAGQRATIFSLGLVGRLMLQSQSAGDGLRALVGNLSVQHRGAVASLSVSGDTALFTFSVYQPETESADQIADGYMALVVNAMRVLRAPDWRPVEVLLPRATPTDREPYRRHFRAPVRFNHEIATLVFPAQDLAHQISGADPVLRALLEKEIEQLKRSQGSEFLDDIRRLLRTRLTSTRCSAEDIAELLAMHRRTLSRRLKDSGMGYRTIANEIRFEIARQLLEDTEVPPGQIAAALGYSEASAFTRAFRRWSGRTPTAWRGDVHPN